MTCRSVIYFTLFRSLILVTKSENPFLLTTANTEQTTIAAECVLKLSSKYFVEKKALSGSIVIININSYASTTQMLLLRTIHGGVKYSVMVKDSLLKHANASHFPEKAKNYMLILTEKEELTRNINQLNKLPTWNPLAKAVVYYQLEDGENGPAIAIDFINKLRSHKLFKTIVFIFSPVSEQVVAYTWNPYTATNCGGKCEYVITLDICKNSKIYQIEKQSDMFPLNMKGCPLVVYAVISEPYVLPPVKKLISDAFNDTFQFERGGEISLIQIISEFTNMSLIMRMSEEPENWGVIQPNGSATGAYKILKNDEVDIVIGNIEVTRSIRKWFDPTISYTQDEMTWCVATARQASTWDNLVNIFQWTTWLATLLSFVLMGLLFHYMYYREQAREVTKWPTNSLLMTFSMLLGWGAQFEPKTATFRILIFGWLCFSTNMGISYVSFLRSFLMHPRFEKQISCEGDLIQSKMPLGGREIYRSYFKSNNRSSFYLYRKYNSTTFAEGIRRAAFQRNFAVVSSRRQGEYMDEVLGKGTPLVFCFPESDNLYKYGVVLLARKWFPMLSRFNLIIRSLTENGLIDKWNEELFIHSNKADVTSAIVPLGFEHLLGAFIFIGLMYAFSILVFLGEILYGAYVKNGATVFSNVMKR